MRLFLIELYYYYYYFLDCNRLKIEIKTNKKRKLFY